MLLIDSDGESLGELDPRDALARAQEQGLTLVEISPQAKPPVCRIMDYGKFAYDRKKDQRKKQAAAKKKQIEIKEVKFRPTTDEGDFKVKMRNITRFLEDGNKVKVTVRFRGREVVHNQIGRTILDRIAKETAELQLGQIEQQSKMEGRQMMMIIAPAKK